MTRTLGLALLVAPCFIASGVVAAESPDTLALVWRALPGTVRVGERVTLRAAAPVPDAATRLVGPSPGASGSIDIVASAPSPAGPDSAAWTLEVALFDLGSVDLSRLPFRLDGPGGTRSAMLRDARITVEGTLADTAGAEDLRDVKGPVPVPLRWRWGRVATALILAAVAVAGILYWRRRRRRPVAAILPYEPVRSPEDIALTALRDLEREAFPARGQMKEHYVRLSGILRRYVEDRFHVPAVESTTRELSEALLLPQGRQVGGATTLVGLLEASDLVKFAKVDPGSAAAGAALTRARSWIEHEARPAPAEEVVRAVR